MGAVYVGRRGTATVRRARRVGFRHLKPRTSSGSAPLKAGGQAADILGAGRTARIMADIPTWHVVGDWFDNCSCAVACPCTFAQPPDNGYCDSVLFWHIQRGHYGDVNLDGLSYVRVGRWEGDLWAGKVKGAAGIFVDERADARQAEALPAIFQGRVGGFPAQVGALFTAAACASAGRTPLMNCRAARRGRVRARPHGTWPSARGTGRLAGAHPLRGGGRRRRPLCPRPMRPPCRSGRRVRPGRGLQLADGRGRHAALGQTASR